MTEQIDNRTATQRISDLETVLSQVYGAVMQHSKVLESLLQMQGDMALIKDVLKILNRKTEAMIQLQPENSPITAESVSALVIKMNVEELKTAVETAVTNGNLVATDVVADGTYLVVEELDAEGTVVNPRVQFPLNSQEAVTQEALKGKKAGDVVSFGENKLNARVLEVYTVVDTNAAPTEAAAPAAETTATDAPTTEATVSAEAAPTSAEAEPAAQLDSPPTETPVGFELNYHGTPESKLASGN